MYGVQPSLTARGAAVHRAAHQVLEGGAIFADPLACAILGAQPDVIADEEAADPSNRPIRLFIAARSRLAEDALSYAVGRGVRQAVVLAAGFDTFGLRNPMQTRVSEYSRSTILPLKPGSETASRR
jgi:O-methyltransferase involved in polyketide biosynthesis